MRIYTDSSHIDKGPLYLTEYDFKIAKIITNELLKFYLTNRLQELERIGLGNLVIGRLATGSYRKLSKEEVEYLKSR